MLRTRLIPMLLVMACIALLPSALFAQNAGQTEEEKLWDDFVHYCTIVNIPMAVGTGESLINKNIEAAELMRIIENSLSAGRAQNSDLPKYMIVIDRTVNLRVQRADLKPQAEKLNDVASRVRRMIIDAQVKLSRDPVRIRKAIEDLAGPAEMRIDAMNRLKAAGQFAAPELIAVFINNDDQSRKLRPWVIAACLHIGHPLAVPFGEAIVNLPMMPRQEVARVLGQIRYAAALPYLSKVYNMENITPATKKIVEQSMKLISEQVAWPEKVNAAYLFHLQAENYYKKAPSLLHEPEEDWNPLWIAQPNGELVYKRIPTPVFFDVMTMRMSWHALKLKPDYDQTYSLWIAANFRRDNTLKSELGDAEDPSYSAYQSPEYYARLSGPDRLRPVLMRGLRDHDEALARDAIAALAAVSGNTHIPNVDEPHNQPLLAAMNYTSARVRYEAALAIAGALPQRPYFGAQRVIPVLVESLREQKLMNVFAVAPSVETRNLLSQALNEVARMEVYQANSIGAATKQLDKISGIDLIVLKSPMKIVKTSYDQIRRNFKLQTAPVIILATSSEYIPMKRAFLGDHSAIVIEDNIDETVLSQAVQRALNQFKGDPLSADEALDYAKQSLVALEKIAVSSNKVFDILNAERGLTEALDDSREEVAIGASGVLALVNRVDAQKALAARALDAQRTESIRVAMFLSLAKSAKMYGNRLEKIHLDRINTVVGQASGPLADAAAEAHGALSLPTERGASLIISKEQ